MNEKSKYLVDHPVISIYAETKFACDAYHDERKTHQPQHLSFHPPPALIRPKTKKAPGQLQPEAKLQILMISSILSKYRPRA
jgi:hypothetical protein